MKAELYALTHRGNPGDLSFYADACHGFRSVLELGSGYGRVLAALAGRTRRLVGIERDPELLTLARRNLRTLPRTKRGSVRLVAADMRRFTLAQRFERVLLPYNALYCLLTQRDALSCFRAVHRALEPGGLFLLDVWNAESFHADVPVRGTSGSGEAIVSVQHGGRVWDVFEQLRMRRAAQRLHVSYRYVPRGGGDPITIPIAQRYFLAAELTQLLERAGFAIVSRYGGFTRSRYTRRSPYQIVVARAL